MRKIKMKIKPIGTNVLLKKYKKAEEKKLILTTNPRDEFPNQGTIVETGHNCSEIWSLGDRVCFKPHSQQYIDEELFLVDEEAIRAFIDEEND
jgi:co-chaperonin GroES (HSP10)